MAEITSSQGKNCKVCGQPVTVIPYNQVVVHVGGGEKTQKCNNQTCGWTGGQAGGHDTCPRCGDKTSLTIDHVATL